MENIAFDLLADPQNSYNEIWQMEVLKFAELKKTIETGCYMDGDTSRWLIVMK